MSPEEMFNEAIEFWGMNDIVTIMLSQKMDKDVTKEQVIMYGAYKEKCYVSTVCN